MKKLLLLLLLLAAGAPAWAQEPTPLPAPVIKPRGIVLFDTTTARGLAISGTVRDGNGPLPGATVLTKGTTRGTSTDAQGRYLLLVPRGGRATLVFSMVGYVAQERRVGKDVVINVVLKPYHSALSKLVVMGYGAPGALRGRMAGIAVQSSRAAASFSPGPRCLTPSGLRPGPATPTPTWPKTPSKLFIKSRLAPLPSTLTTPVTPTCAVSSPKASYPRPTPCGSKKC